MENIKSFEEKLNYDETGFDQIKALICQIIQVILEIQNEIRINSLMFKIKMISMSFYNKQDKFLKQINSEVEENIDKAVVDILGDEATLNKRNVYLIPIEKINQLVKESLENNFYLYLWNSDDFISLLLSLILSKDIKLKTEAIRILYSLHSKRFKIRESITDQVILDLVNSKKAYRECQDLSVVLRIFGETSEKWYSDSQGEQFKTFKYMLEEIEKLLLKPKLKLDDSDNESDFESEEEMHMTTQFDNVNKLELVKSYFMMKMKHGVDKFYQSMFKHLGVFPSLCEVLLDDLECGKETLTSEHQILIERIYFILAYSITDNQSNKT